MMQSERLTGDPNRISLGLLPSGPDPVGEWPVHRQPPAPYIGACAGDCKRRDWTRNTANRPLVAAVSRPGTERDLGLWIRPQAHFANVRQSPDFWRMALPLQRALA